MCRVKISNEQNYHNQNKFNHQLAFSIFIWQCLIVWGLPPTPAVPHVLTENRWTLNSSKNRLIERSSVTKLIVKCDSITKINNCQFLICSQFQRKSHSPVFRRKSELYYYRGAQIRKTFKGHKLES